MPFARNLEPRSSVITLTLLALACSSGDGERVTSTSVRAPTSGSESAAGPELDPPDARATAAPTQAPRPSASPVPTASTQATAQPPGATSSTAPLPPPVQDLPRCDVGAVGVGSEAARLLSAFGVGHDDFVRRTIFSWTIPEQIEELRANLTLLTRSMTSSGERGRAADLILERAASDEIAQLLAAPQFENRRFGWSNPWATLLGWSGEDYGDRLLAITLKPSAWVGRMRADESSTLSWEFSDLEGNLVEHSSVLANPERLAMIYFVDERDSPQCRGSLLSSGSTFREYFVLNESMLESYAAGTPELQEEVSRGIAALEALLAELTAAECGLLMEPPPCWRARVVNDWANSPSSDSAVAGYERALAFPNALYEPVIANIRSLVERLRAVPFDFDPLFYAYPTDEVP